MTFKMILWGTLVFFQYGSQLQVGTALLLCVGRLALHAQFEPYRMMTDNAFDYVTLIITALFGLGGIMLQSMETYKTLAIYRGDDRGSEASKNSIYVVELVLHIMVVIVFVVFAAFWLQGLWLKRKKLSAKFQRVVQCVGKRCPCVLRCARRCCPKRCCGGGAHDVGNSGNDTDGDLELTVRRGNAFGSSVSEGKTGAGTRRTNTAHGSHHTESNITGSSAAGGVPDGIDEICRNPMHRKHSSMEQTAPGLNSPWHNNEVGADHWNPMHRKHSSLEQTAPGMDSPWHNNEQQSDVSQRGKRVDSKTKSGNSFDQATVHVRSESKSAARSGAPVESGAPSEDGCDAGCANLRLTSLHLSDLPLSVGGVGGSTDNGEVGEDGDGAGGMQTNPMAPTNYRLGKLQAHARHSSVEL
jgi:hypothetical protein